MKFDKVLEGRRTIRRYKNEPVEKDEIKKVLKAASLAPSWKNTECWRWYVVTEEKLLEELKQNGLAVQNQPKVENVPCLIVAACETGLSGRDQDGEYASNTIGEGWSYFDTGLAVENLCLEAERLSLGTLIMGIFNEEVVRKMLSIAESQHILAVIALGHPDVEPPMPKRRKLKETAVFFE